MRFLLARTMPALVAGFVTASCSGSVSGSGPLDPLIEATAPPRTVSVLKATLLAYADGLDKSERPCAPLGRLTDQLKYFGGRERVLGLDDAEWRTLNKAAADCEKDPGNAGDVLRALANGTKPPADTGKNTSVASEGYTPVGNAQDIAALLTALATDVGPERPQDDAARLQACKTLGAFLTDMQDRSEEWVDLDFSITKVLALQNARSLCQKDPAEAVVWVRNAAK